MGLLGEHRQRAGGVYLALCRVPQDPPGPATEESDAKAHLQEVGGGFTTDGVRRGRRCVHREQLLPRFQEGERRSLTVR